MMKATVDFICRRLAPAVVALVSVVMLLVFLTVSVNAVKLGSYGIVFRNNTDQVDVQGATARAGLQDGDRIDLQALTPAERFGLFDGGGVADTSQLTVQVIRGNRSFPLTLHAQTPAFAPMAKLARDIGVPVCFFLSMGLATALFLRSPRPLTLTFYLYTALLQIKLYQTPLFLAPWPINLISDLLVQVVYPGGQIMLLLFAFWLYGKPGRNWRRILATAIVLAIIDFFAWIDPIVWLTFQRLGIPGPMRVLMSGSDAALLAVVLAGLAYIASEGSRFDRQRVTWIVGGIALTPILDITWAITDIASALVNDTFPIFIKVQAWTDALQPWFGLAGTAFVCYGLLSGRIVDFRFAVWRAAFYGGATVLVVALFGAIEWTAEQLLETTRPAIYMSLIAALAIGFAMRPVHARVEKFLDSIFLRDRQQAEAALRRACKALATSSSERALAEFLVEEPVDVLDLSSSALFTISPDGSRFDRVAGRGWYADEAPFVDADDPMIVRLQAEGHAVAIDRRTVERAALPAEERAPAVAIPIAMRGHLAGFVVYGAKRDGTRLDDAEVALLEAVAASAAAAYDHIDAEHARERIAELEQQIRSLGGTAKPA
jgi:hypothetical protein